MNKLSSPSYKLLVIDDNEAIHDDLKKILAPVNTHSELEADEELLFGVTSTPEVSFEIHSAFQGQEGMACVEKALAESEPYALAFVDIRMPPGWFGL